jgi:uncharacterized Tic20 family protein
MELSSTTSSEASYLLPKNKNEQKLAAMAHLLPLLGLLVPPHLWIFCTLPPLIFWQFKRGHNVFLSAVGLESLIFQIWVSAILTLVYILSHIPLIGAVFALALPLAIITVLALMFKAAMECKQGRFPRYPWIPGRLK